MREKTAEHDLKDAFRHSDPVLDEALNWLVHLEAGGFVDKAIRAEFDAWLVALPENSVAWEEVQTVWVSPETLVASQVLDLHLASQPVSLQRARKTFRRPLVSHAWAAAACLTVMVGATYLAVQSMPRMLADYTTDAGERRDVTLPDGSRMVLNTGSAVSLDFGAGKRGVRLIEGEAWFDVVHDAARPFHVAGHYSDVEVKGTAFAVKVEGEADTVSLQRGAVDAVHARKVIAVVHLVPGESVVASRDAMSDVQKFDADHALGWLQGRVVIEAKPLGAALSEVGRYFDGRIMVLNRGLLDVPVSGDYRTDRAGAAIASLAAAAGGKITRLPGGYIIIR